MTATTLEELRSIINSETAKVIVRNNTGRFPERSYFNGCATGGHQAMMEVQRFPADYDGVVASVVLLLARETMAPPEGAGALSVTLPLDGAPPVTLLGLSVTEVRFGPGGGDGVTMRGALSF